MKDNLDKILAAFAGTDLARLAIPKPTDIDKIILSSGLVSQVELMSKQLRKPIEPQQSIMSRFVPQMAEFAEAIEMQQKPQIEAFQSIALKLQPLIIQQTKWAQDFSKIALQVGPILEAIRTMSSFNAFQRYRDAFEEFGGGINPDNVTDKEIAQTIEGNQQLIEEVNKVVLQAELDDVSPLDIPELIFSFLIKKVPNLNRRTYGIIVLILTTAITFFGLYSDYTTNVALDETVLPTLKQNTKTLEDHSKDHEEIKERIVTNFEELNETQAKIDSTHTAIGDLQKAFENYKDATNDKLELIIEEMRKQDNEEQ